MFFFSFTEFNEKQTEEGKTKIGWKGECDAAMMHKIAFILTTTLNRVQSTLLYSRRRKKKKAVVALLPKNKNWFTVWHHRIYFVYFYFDQNVRLNSFSPFGPRFYRHSAWHLLLQIYL